MIFTTFDLKFSSLKRVLIITYYWPPAGGGGVQRWLKMSKYLPEYGWQPVIYTPSNPEVTGMDDALVKEIHPDTIIIQSPIWEPYEVYKKVLGIKKEEKIYSGFITKETKRPAWFKNFITWIRGNFFIPDARRFWIRPGAKFLIDYLQSNKVEAIISTGPPHSTHMIAMKVHNATQIPWIADFRDPWTQIDFYRQLHLTWFADKYHHYLERKVLLRATKVVSVSPSWQRDLINISGRKDIQLITNGYDPKDFETSPSHIDDTFTISHIGSLNEDRNPHILWKALKQLVDTTSILSEKLCIQLIGPVDNSIFTSLASHSLEKYVAHIPFVDHHKAIEIMKTASSLLLCINNTDNKSGIIPGKLFEYLGARRPILCIGPSSGDSIDILKGYSNAFVVPYDELEVCKNCILNIFDRRKDVSLFDGQPSDKYSRKNLAGEYSKLLNSLISTEK